MQGNEEFAQALSLALTAFEQGRPDTRELIRKAAVLDPDQPDIAFLEGTLALSDRDYDRALARLSIAASSSSAPPAYKFNLGLAYFYRGMYPSALDTFLGIGPGFSSDAFFLITVGDCLARMERLPEAAERYRAAIALRPEDGFAWFKLALCLHKGGSDREFGTALLRAYELLPKSAENLVRIRSLAREHDCWSLVILCCRELIHLDPRNLENYTALSEACFKAGDPGAALTVYMEFVRRSEKTADLYGQLASLAFQARNLEVMKDALENALVLDPDHAGSHVLLAKYHSLAGDNNAAVTECLQALQIVPGYGKAMYQLADMEVATSADAGYAAAVTRLGNRNIEPEERVTLAYALGRIADREQRHADAFAYFENANALQRELAANRGVAYDRRRTEGFFADIKHKYGKTSLYEKTPAAGSTQSPIFIVGMPRSGTTLMDRIISSHPDVRSTGENQAMARIQHEVDAILQREPALPLQALLEEHAGRFANQYWQSLLSVGRSVTRFTDKAPMNFLHLGLIVLLFPKAKIIHMRRDAMNVCLSMFMHNFSEAFPCANDLEDLGHYHRLYQDLMAFWHRTLPGRFMDVEYADIVDQPEATVRRVLDRCALEWDPRCLAFHENRQAAFTFSELQVRRPLYRSSLQKSKAYEPWLAPLRLALEAAG